MCCVLFLVLLGFGLRAYGLGEQELRGDEAFSYLVARRPLVEIVPALLRQGDPHPPLHYLALHLWMRLAGGSEFSMRYASLLPGVLLLPLMFQLGRQVGGDGAGVLLTGLASVSQLLVWVAQDARNQYTLAAFFSTLAALSLVRALRCGTWRAWALYAVACVLTVYSHTYAAFALLAHGLYVMVGTEGRKRAWAWALSGLVALSSFVPWLVTAVPRVLAGHLQDPSHPEIVPYLMAAGVELTVGSALGQQMGRWLFLGALVLCLVGAWALFRRRPEWAALLVSWLVGTTLVIFFIQFLRAAFNPFYIVMVAPAWGTLVSLGVVTLWRTSRWPWRGLAALGVGGLIAASLVSLTGYYTDPAYDRTNGYRDVVAHISAEAAPGDLFVAHFPDPVWDYYFEDSSVPRVLQPTTRQAGTRETEDALAELAAQYDRLWFVPYHRSVWDREDVVYRWLSAHSLLEQEAVYRNLTLSAYRPMHALDRVVTPLDVPLGDQLRLEGAFVTVDGRPADLSASPLTIPLPARVNVTLLWRALAEVPESYTVFVHLLGDHGRLIAQHDGWPVAGTRPTLTWSPGERLLDLHPVVVPHDLSVGGGTLLVGMYHSTTLQRLSFEGGRDAIWLADVKFDLASLDGP